MRAYYGNARRSCLRLLFILLLDCVSMAEALHPNIIHAVAVNIFNCMHWEYVCTLYITLRTMLLRYIVAYKAVMGFPSFFIFSFLSFTTRSPTRWVNQVSIRESLVRQGAKIRSTELKHFVSVIFGRVCIYHAMNAFTTISTRTYVCTFSRIEERKETELFR